MNKDMKNFVWNTERLLKVIPEDSEFYKAIHEEKPLCKQLAKLFPEGKTRISIPVSLEGGENWESRWIKLFTDFHTTYKDSVDYVAGKVTIKGNQVKLMKALVAHYLEEYTPDNFERFKETLGEEFKWLVDNKPSSKSQEYIVLSRDPMDFYMASTSQPNKSCIRLDSTDGFWTGIMNAIADPYRLLAYISTGDEVSYSLDSKSNFPKWFKPFKLTADKFTGRSWAIYSGKEGSKAKIYLPRFFGTGIKFGTEVSPDLTFIKSSTYKSPKYRVVRCYQESPIVTPTMYYDKMRVEIEGNKFKNVPSASSGSVKSFNRRSSLASMLSEVV